MREAVDAIGLSLMIGNMPAATTDRVVTGEPVFVKECPMRRLCVFVLWLFVATWSLADDRATCTGRAGAYLSGTVITPPAFVHGHVVQGVELSHARFALRSDDDGKTFDVAADNVFANGYEPGTQSVPVPLNSIAVGDRLALCGALYPQGLGIHFVHTNCGSVPTTQHPDGWVRRLTSDGGSEANMEANQTYCGIFGHFQY